MPSKLRHHERSGSKTRICFVFYMCVPFSLFVFNPNLDEIKPDIVRVLTAVKNGIGVMPAYEGMLSDDEIKAVASYVAESTN